MLKFLTRLSKALSSNLALEERLDQLEHEFQKAQLDWDELYDKMRHMMGRVAKRSAIIERADSQPTEEVATDASLINGGARLPHGGMLTERQKQVQQMILRRRGGG